MGLLVGVMIISPNLASVATGTLADFVPNSPSQQADDYIGIPPHSGHVTWNDGGYHHHHYHSNTHDLNPWDANTGHERADPLPGNEDYDAYGFWINEGHFPIDLDGLQKFSHGFIDEFPLQGDANQNIPEYRFIGDTTLFNHTGASFDAAPMVREAFAEWSGIVSDDAHLLTGLGFREYTPEDHAEIDIEFIDYISGAVGRWVPSLRRLEFTRYDDAAKTIKHKWYNGGIRAGIPNNATVDDFETVALHEVGHIVGLHHQTSSNDKDDVMYVLAGRGDVIWSGPEVSFRSLSGDDTLAARDLYSIPEPGCAALLCLAGLALLRRRRK